MGVSYFLSDIHIKGNQDLSYLKLNQFFITNWKSTPGDIYLLGDIFDLWVSNHQIFINTYKELIDHLSMVKQQGFKVVYFEGNHDLHLSKYWQETLGFEVQKEIEFYYIDGFLFRLEHGDLINQQDFAYLKLRRFLRNPYMTFLAHTLPGAFWDFLGKKWSQESRKTSQTFRAGKSAEIIKMIRNHAKQQVASKDFDVIISGHMHVRDMFEFEVNNKKHLSINLGSWFEEKNILQFTPKSKNNLLENFNWIQL